MAVEQMKTFRPDCQIAEQQVAWLNSMRPTETERVSSRMKANLIGIAHPDYQANADIGNYKIDWWVNQNIKEVYRQCAKQS
jgi:hypothetical protein